MASDFLARVAAFSARRAGLVLLAAFLLAAGCAWISATRLGVSTDTGKLFSASLPWRQRQAAMQQAFPQNEDLLVAVIDGDIPETAEATAAALEAALRPDTAHFTLVRRPDAAPYLERHALLFLDQDKLQELLDQLIDAQPFLGQLAADPSLRGLMGALQLIAEGVERGQANLAPFEAPLRGFHQALEAAAAGHPRVLSWQRLLAGPVADLAGRYRFVVTKPKLDFGAIEPGAAAADAARQAAATLPFVRDGSAHVRLTGAVALENEEFATISEGAMAGLLGSLAVIVLLLYLAVRSIRLIVPIVATLLLGLLCTTAFAALTVGTLNLVSVAFAILFVGIAVDFAIQFAARFREARLSHPATHPSLDDAVAGTAQRAGVQILVAALGTAAGFLAFTPTSFVGVAQLGLIAGGGMLIAFLCTLLVMPALLAVCRAADAPAAAEVGLAWLRPLDPVLVRWRWPVLVLAGALTIAGAVALPRLAFDGDPLNTKDPSTEAMRTLRDLMADPLTNPYSIEALAPSVDAAAALAAKLRALPLVDEVLTLGSLAPENQAGKLPFIADAANLLAPTLAARPTPARPDAAALRTAVQDAARRLSTVEGALAEAHPLRLVAADLRALATQPDQVLLQADGALTRFLPQQLERLRTVLSVTEPATEASIPADLARDWRLPDGRVKVQATPKREASGGPGLHRFVAQIRTVAPDAAGSAITITESADTITAAFRAAALYALAAIAVILAVALRRMLDIALVLAALLLSALLTVLACVLLPLPLNFANIIALPLLLGVGVSFNIYFVMNWRAGYRAPLGSATTRAVLFSALTTADAFGALALSRHPGTASMGELLLVSLACTLAVSLLVLPALLAAVGSPAKR